MRLLTFFCQDKIIRATFVTSPRAVPKTCLANEIQACIKTAVFETIEQKKLFTENEQLDELELLLREEVERVRQQLEVKKQTTAGQTCRMA